jgi:hypothetical protein
MIYVLVQSMVGVKRAPKITKMLLSLHPDEVSFSHMVFNLSAFKRLVSSALKHYLKIADLHLYKSELVSIILSYLEVQKSDR